MDSPYVVCMIRQFGNGVIFSTKHRFCSFSDAEKAMQEYRKKFPQHYFFVGNILRKDFDFWSRQI